MADTIDLLRDVTGESALEPATNLEDIENWNSLSIIGFLAKVDKEIGVRVNPSLLANCRNVGDVMNVVESFSK